MLGHVDRGLRLLRARTAEIPKLMELELLEPWAQEKPEWYPAWALTACQRLTQRLQRPPVIYQVQPATSTRTEVVHTEPPRVRLNPPRCNRAVGTECVETHSVSTQTDLDLVKEPAFLLRLLMSKGDKPEVTYGPPWIPPMTMADSMLNEISFRRDVLEMEHPTLVEDVILEHFSTWTGSAAPEDAIGRDEDVVSLTQPPVGWGSWRDENDGGASAIESSQCSPPGVRIPPFDIDRLFRNRP